MSKTNAKAVIVISSHVARGSVGNRAAVFALEILGLPVWAIPTITLPWHPGHGPSTKLIPEPEDFEAFLDDISKAPWIDEVAAILTGYMANAEQVSVVANLISALKGKNKNLVHVCDPVIGDIGGLYVSEDTASSIRNLLVPQCDIATPNCYELAWLTGSPTPEDIQQSKEQAMSLAAETVLVTSTPIKQKTGNLLITEDQNFLASHQRIENPPNGPGDLTAAIFTGHYLSGMKWMENLERTTASVFEILQQSEQRGSNELTLERDAERIINPCALITTQMLDC